MRKRLLWLYKQRKKGVREKKDIQSIVDEIEELKVVIPKSKSHQVVSSLNKIEYVSPCPICKGCIQKKDYRCTLCDVEVCKNCLICLQHDHQCIKEDVENAASILQHTKPCPRCAVRIYKISGCDQMWCIMCHCTFSYETGIETKAVIHNPHYFEWFFGRDGQNENGNDECDFVVFVQRALQRQVFKERREYHQMIGLFRLILHIDNVVLPEFVTNHQTNQDLRFKYLLNDIDDNDFRRIFYKREIKNLKKMAVLDLYNSFNAISKNLLSEYIHEKLDFTSFCQVFQRIFDETFECGNVIVSSYGGKVKHFFEIEKYQYSLVRFYERYDNKQLQ